MSTRWHRFGEKEPIKPKEYVLRFADSKKTSLVFTFTGNWVLPPEPGVPSVPITRYAPALQQAIDSVCLRLARIYPLPGQIMQDGIDVIIASADKSAIVGELKKLGLTEKT